MKNNTRMKSKSSIKKGKKGGKSAAPHKDKNNKSLATQRAELRKEKEYEKYAVLLNKLLTSEMTEECPVILNTSIAELQDMNFSERERESMITVLNAEKINAPILSGTVKLRYRIELAAALLTFVISKAQSACETHRISRPNNFVEMLLGLTVKRAKEILNQRNS
ncbi:MAG: hypothetical protein ACKOW3_04990 [Hyphomicrobium sp.]